jgi:hypothetical protein
VTEVRVKVAGREYVVTNFNGHRKVLAVCRRRCNNGRITESLRFMRAGSALSLAAIAQADRSAS